jgi:deoxyribodipyrimidine photo-lyase
LKTPIAICWFRQDLRLSDNPALTLAAQYDGVLPVYILDDTNPNEHAMGRASRWWLHHSLHALNRSLDGSLSIYQGNPIDIITDLIVRFNVQSIYWNRCYEPWQMNRDITIKKILQNQGVKVSSTNGSLLWEPWTITKSDGDPYKVFTPFYQRGCLQAQMPREPLPIPNNIKYYKDNDRSLKVEDLDLLPQIRWDKKLGAYWCIGEAGAHQRLDQFINEGLFQYKEGRNFPDKPYVSRISPHLHFGEISPNQIWHTLKNIGNDTHIEHFCRQLIWREFSYSQLYYHPQLPTRNLQSKFDDFPWSDDELLLKTWQRGRTGIPMVDAGMRELWETGYMHNRVRMIVGSFLVKSLRLHWHHGEKWFWDTLVDADLANNSASWQWIAGCGADAAPYFRIFNPVTQGQKFDPHGCYVRQFVPELADLPDKYLFSPWKAPKNVLKAAGIELGSTYPLPIVDLKQSRIAALEAFQSLKPSH